VEDNGRLATITNLRTKIGLLLLLAGAAMWMLRTFPPWQYPIYPSCPIRALTGWRCPGCGTTHALAALLAGHWREAWHYNAMAAMAYPVLAIFGVQRSLRLLISR
jgi:Protein of unknown function (DUF2752)